MKYSYQIHNTEPNYLNINSSSDVLENVMYKLINNVTNNIKSMRTIANINDIHIDKLLKKCTILKIKCTEHDGNNNYMIIDEYIISFSHVYDSFIIQSSNCSSIISHDAKPLEFITREFKKYAYEHTHDHAHIHETNNILHDMLNICANKPQHINANENKPQHINDVKNEPCDQNIAIDTHDVINDVVKDSVIPKTHAKIQQVGDLQNIDEIDEQLDNLKNKMEKMMDMRDEQIDNNTSMKKKVNDQEDALNDYVLEKITDEKQQLKRNNEKNEEMVRVFRCDKKVYRLIKEDVKNGIISNEEIPSLFEKKYPIFEFMDLHNLIVLNDLHDENEFKLYCEYYDEAYPPKIAYKNTNDEYIPHNVNYLPEDEKNRLLAQKQVHPDMINDFINKKCDLQDKKNSNLHDKINYISEENSSDCESDESDESDESCDMLNLEAKIAPLTNFVSVDDIMEQLDVDDNDIKINLTKVQKNVIPFDESIDINGNKIICSSKNARESKINVVPFDEHEDINIASIESILTDVVKDVPNTKSSLACALDK